MSEQKQGSDIAQARKLAREVDRHDDTTVIEALLADAIRHLADALDDLRRNPPVSLNEMTF